MQNPPPQEVLQAFGADGPASRLAGGHGGTFRAGNVVLKRSANAAETSWIAELFTSLRGPGFRVPASVRARDGSWVVAGWSAFEFVEGAHAGPNGGRWPETLAACRAFHAAIKPASCPPFIAAADHAWAVADRLAWGELSSAPLAPFTASIARIERLLRPLDAPTQVIHGDFTANVLFAEGLPPCVIDFSPYWRPARFAEAIVIVDAVTWAQAQPEEFALEVRDPDFVQLLVRAALRRVHELDQHSRRGRSGLDSELDAYTPVIGWLERMLSA